MKNRTHDRITMSIQGGVKDVGNVTTDLSGGDSGFLLLKPHKYVIYSSVFIGHNKTF